MVSNRQSLFCYRGGRGIHVMNYVVQIVLFRKKKKLPICQNLLGFYHQTLLLSNIEHELRLLPFHR